MQNNQAWDSQHNRFNEDRERNRYRFKDEGKRRYIQDHGWHGNSGYEDRYSENAMFCNDDRNGDNFYNQEGCERPIVGTGYSAGSDIGNYGNDYNPGGYEKGSQQGSFGRNLGYNSYAEHNHRDRRDINAADFNQNGRGRYDHNYNQRDQQTGERYEGAGSGMHQSYRSSYHSGYGATGDSYADQGLHTGNFAGEYGLNYEGPNYSRDRDWWDRTKDKLASLMGDRDAGRRRRIDEIIGKYKGKGPKNCHRSEERVRDDIYNRLSDDDWLDASDIDVQVQGDEVILSGKVNSREDKRRAEDLVESISGVRHVENRIRVGDEPRPVSNATLNTPIR
jgi:osmotically-inducible protein OsmY